MVYDGGARSPSVVISGHMKPTSLEKKYSRIKDRFIDTGIPWDELPLKLHEGPPYDVGVIDVIFERMMDGATMASVCRDDPTFPRVGEVMSYILKHPTLYDRYLEVRKIQGAAYEDRILCHVNATNYDGQDIIPDVQRDTLAINTYKWLLGTMNRELYGEKKQIDVNTTIDLTESMRLAEERVSRRLGSDIIEGELVEDDPLDALGLYE